MTIHRAYGYVDRSNLTDGSPLRVVMASEGRQADGIDLRMAGVDLARYRANPVLGYGHNYYGRTNLPIGRVAPDSIAIDGTTIAGDLEFDPGDEFAREIERKMRTGFLNAVSIGFDVTEWENEADNYWRGGVATKWQLSELSVVPIGMDANALVTSGRGLNDPGLIEAARSCSAAEFEQLLQRLRAIDNIGRAAPHETSPPPPAPGIPEATAAALVAAFDPKETIRNA